MHARKRLDIGWSDILSGLVACAFARREADLRRDVESWFDPGGSAFAALSVRSGLDLYLEMLALPKGSEVLMSALTIPDMWKVVEHNGLVPVPVDIDPETLAPRPGAWRAAVTPRTKLALFAHLFGTRLDLAPLEALRREHGILILEDCAQAYTGADFKGDPAADVSMFSFGPIKTATALAGGVLRIKDRYVLDKMRAAHVHWPRQSRWGYTQRLFKYALLKSISYPLLYSGFIRACTWCGTTHDAVIQSTVRGFKGGDFFQKLRHRPAPPLLSLMRRRLMQGSSQRVEQRTARGRRLIDAVGPGLEVPGVRAPLHTYWVFTVLSNRPDELVATLRSEGFDATRIATMSALSAPADRPELEPREARALLARLVYLPVYPELSASELERLAGLVRAHLRSATGAEESEHPRTQLA
ncbi:MAG: DegT/DnrJ/EryC1/StrS aminotransferase family protein [Planctomycetes bacterium]|nr:DegT/DnrJ/EryC1/StrS aminotransferase family protein [Planctomycetota bacterium]